MKKISVFFFISYTLLLPKICVTSPSQPTEQPIKTLNPFVSLISACFQRNQRTL